MNVDNSRLQRLSQIFFSIKLCGDNRVNSNLTSSRWQVAEATPEDGASIRALFEKVFKHEMSLAHWDWKYRHGRGEGVVVRHGDEVVAFYGAVKRQVMCRGELTNTLQCVDTMVDTSERGSLSKKGPYYLAATTFLQKFIGYNLPYLFGFGFPNARVMRLGEILGVQADIGAVVELEWPAQASNLVFGNEFQLSANSHMSLIDEMWHAMSADLDDRIVIVRDMNYLLYRYKDNPSHQYQFHLVTEESGKPQGVLVSRPADGRLLILDLIGPLDNFKSVVAFAQNLAAQDGLSALSTWITEPDASIFTGSVSKAKQGTDLSVAAPAPISESVPEGVVVKDIGVRIPTSVCSPGPSPESLQDAWFLLAGDTDFL
jgi:hypothetical protein